MLQALLRRRRARTPLKKAGRLQDIFGRDNLFVELQDHGIRRAAPHQPAAARDRRASSGRRCSPPTTATTPTAHDAVAHDALLCVQTGSLMSDPDRFKFHGDEHYLKSAAEMRQLFREVPEACDNTLLDRRALPTSRSSSASRSCPTSRCPRASPTTRRTSATSPSRAPASAGATSCPTRSVERLAYELQVIGDMGFSSYFLIVWDLIRHAREHGHPGRPGPRVGGRLRGRLLPADHRPRPDQVRPALRAVPQPESRSRCPTSTWTSTPATATR